MHTAARRIRRANDPPLGTGHVLLVGADGRELRTLGVVGAEVGVVGAEARVLSPVVGVHGTAARRIRRAHDPPLGTGHVLLVGADGRELRTLGVVGAEVGVVGAEARVLSPVVGVHGAAPRKR